MYSRNEILAKEKGYYVDKKGNAYSPNGKKIGTCGDKPYLYIGIKIASDKIIKVYIHRLQAYQKYSDEIYKENIEVRHLNGNSLDNSFDNIEIGTAHDNAMDKSAESRKKYALNASSKIKVYSDSLVCEMLKDRENGMTYSELMKKYNISSKGTLSYILNKRISRNGADG